MRRYRRLVLIDRIIPFLAAFVGLVALAGSVLVQMHGSAERERIAEEMARLRLSVEMVTRQAEELAAAADDGTAEGLLALQERMDRLEAEWETAAAAAPASGRADSASRTVDPSWPTEDCIPTGTRFMATPGEPIPICETPVVISVSAITDDTVLVDGAGTIVENGVSQFPDTGCSVTAFSADIQGFAELRVNCQ
ncbi:MAG TPA: hypothetical protein VGN80_04585 [Devosiaceae bacterium]|jgi:hypothetical protein|nr:hypothetical protein [Devosiaceae bacterium]